MQLVRNPGSTSASAVLEAMIGAIPIRITRFIENEIQFPFTPGDSPTASYTTNKIDKRCRKKSIEHRLTKVKKP